ncbi:hypothetical protein IAT38_003149 [Cryptococcus sp. DSM 104549]
MAPSSILHTVVVGCIDPSTPVSTAAPVPISSPPAPAPIPGPARTGSQNHPSLLALTRSSKLPRTPRPSSRRVRPPPTLPPSPLPSSASLLPPLERPSPHSPRRARITSVYIYDASGEEIQRTVDLLDLCDFQAGFTAQGRPDGPALPPHLSQVRTSVGHPCGKPSASQAVDGEGRGYQATDIYWSGAGRVTRRGPGRGREKLLHPPAA